MSLAAESRRPYRHIHPWRLLKEGCQLELLDLFARAQAALAAYQTEYRAWRALLTERDVLSQESELSPDQLEFLRQQLANFEALRAIRHAIGLDYSGIDCGLDRDGNVVVFEANAAMLVHGNNHAYPYKMPHVRKINAAFDAMLARKALGGA